MEALVQAIVALLAIADPLGAAPFFLALTQGMTRADRARAARNASLAVLAILGAAALAGSAVLALFGVSLPAFRAAGGLVILLTGLEMLGGFRARIQPGADSQVSREDAILVPLAMPLIAGPGAITTVVTLAARARTWRGQLDVLIAVAVTAAVVFATLRLAEWVQARVSARAHGIFVRFMGLVLVAIGAQLVLSGIREFFAV